MWVSSSSSGATTGITLAEEPPRRRAVISTGWNTALSVVAVVALPFLDVLQPLSRRRQLQTIVSHVITAGETIIGDVAIEVDSVFAVTPKRPTLWFPAGYVVPFLPRRKAFISSFGAADQDE